MAMSLEKKRLEIDNIDQRVVELLSRRAELALEVGKEKQAGGMDLKDNAREDDVLRRIRKLNQGPLCDDAVASIYHRIISACLELQQQGEGKH
ncbi:MAG: chorismate mutase [Verrucomicrobiota bacterium]